jgi:hypothetical protein
VRQNVTTSLLSLAFSCVCSSYVVASGPSEPRLVLEKQWEAPVITVKTPGAEGNKHGFQGGCVLKVAGTYHLFTSEMVGDPIGVKMKLGHWKSTDRLHWDRVSTLFESSGELAGQDPRAALWAPMPVYDDHEQLWNLFYVAYRAAPNTKTQWRLNHDGTIWRAISRVKGSDGIGGPYQDVGIILQPGPQSQPWEGLQGTDSFFPYSVGDLWYGFYGSAHTEKLPIQSWQVGLASAPALSGPWKRLPEGNPVMVEKVFIENPIVTRLPDGTYMAVYDSATPNAIGYTHSRDGMHWSTGEMLIVQPQGKNHWAAEIITPLGLVPEGSDAFTLFYTGCHNCSSYAPDDRDVRTDSVGLTTVKLVRR